VRSDKDVLPMLQKHHLDTDSDTIPQLETSHPPLFCPQFLAQDLPFSNSTTSHTHTHTLMPFGSSQIREGNKCHSLSLSLSLGNDRGVRVRV
jgi:hypothetical protein